MILNILPQICTA